LSRSGRLWTYEELCGCHASAGRRHGVAAPAADSGLCPCPGAVVNFYMNEKKKVVVTGQDVCDCSCSHSDEEVSA